MSGRLVGEVVEWLRTPAATGVTVAERMVLLVIAERVNEKDPERKMLRHRTDDVNLFDRLCEATGMGPSGLSKVLRKLAENDLEVRIEIGTTKSGEPVFAYRGIAMGFHLPVLPASAALPERADERGPFPVDNAVDEPVDESAESTPDEDESASKARPDGDPFAGKPAQTGDQSARKGPQTGDPNPSKDNPSNYSPSTPVEPSSLVTVEDAAPPAATPSATTSHHMGWEPDYRDATAYLLTLANEGQEYMDAAAEHLGPNTPVADRVIHAARTAHKAQEGIPA